VNPVAVEYLRNSLNLLVFVVPVTILINKHNEP